jgi:ABC-type multidrug transport system fused ATPase/permease subunit
MWWDEEDYLEETTERKISNYDILKKILPYFREHLRTLIAGFLLLLIFTGCELSGPLILKRIIDEEIGKGQLDGLIRFSLLYAFIFVLGFTIRYFQSILMTRMGIRIVNRIKSLLFGHILGLSMPFFGKYTPGRLIARVESDGETLKMLFSHISVNILQTVLLLFGILTVLFINDPRTTISVILFLPLLLIATYFFIKYIRTIYRKVRQRYANITSFVTEYVQGVPIIRMFHYEPVARARLHDKNLSKYLIERKLVFFEYGFWGVFMFSEVVGTVIVLSIGASKVFAGTMTIGTLILFLEYIRRVFYPIMEFSEYINFIQKAFVSAERIFTLMAIEPDVPEPVRPVHPGSPIRKITFEHVWFAYEGDNWVLKDISFEIEKDRRIAAVGLSGGGKTTLVNLLLRFYDPVRGRICADGTDIRNFSISRWREEIGLVLQDIYLFPGTILDNLRVFDDRYDAIAVEQACETVNANALVGRLERGFETALSERGANLSMGERQLLSFARALVREPRLLVLDEATSSVDPYTEGAIQRGLNRLLSGRTSFIVAHRLSTIVNSDNIIVIHKGQLVESGNHSSLMLKNGIYRSLFELQFGENAEGLQQ